MSFQRSSSIHYRMALNVKGITHRAASRFEMSHPHRFVRIAGKKLKAQTFDMSHLVSVMLP